jgi:hypothetical protein
MSWRDLVPDWGIAVLFGAFWVSSAEIGPAFWSRFDGRLIALVADILSEHQAPHFGKMLLGDTWSAVVVTVGYCLGWLFVIAFLIAYAYDGGWLRAVGLLLIAIAAYALYSLGVTLLGVDEPRQVVGTVAAVLTLVLILALALQVTWFGLRIGSLA